MIVHDKGRVIDLNDKDIIIYNGETFALFSRETMQISEHLFQYLFEEGFLTIVAKNIGGLILDLYIFRERKEEQTCKA